MSEIQNEWLYEYKSLLDRLKSESPHKQTTIINSKLIALLEASPFLDMIEYPFDESEVYTSEDIKDRVQRDWNKKSLFKKALWSIREAFLWGVYLFFQTCIMSPIYALSAIIAGSFMVIGGFFFFSIFFLVIDMILTLLGLSSILDEETRQNFLKFFSQ